MQGIKNYKTLFGLSLFLITCLLIFSHLWKITSAKMGTFSYNPSELLWYIAFNEWFLVSIPDTQEQMEQDLRSGRLAYLLPRPISYLGSIFMEAFGTLTVNLLVLGIVTFTFTWSQVASSPFSLGQFLLTLLFGYIAGAIAILFLMAIGLSAFWLQEVSPFFWIWEKLLFMLGGLMLPLAVYPNWLQEVASYTPFPTLLGERSALALEYSKENALSLGLHLILWGAIALVFVNFLYRKGLQIVHVEGG